MKYLFIYILSFSVSSSIGGSIVAQNSPVHTTDSTLSKRDENIISYSIPDSVIIKYPFKNQNNINRFFPGVTSYFQNFYIRGGKNEETGFFIDGVKYNDLFTGDNPFFINPNAIQNIDFYNGFIPANIGNTSAGLFNYKLKTGGDKLEFNVEHQTDNITFTNDAFSGKKRMGAQFYGYNETNLNLGGPLFLNNIRFFANVNYLYQRDKNPQLYPGIENLTFVDNRYQDSITINLPAGIVPLNSFESINVLSTLLFNLGGIKIKAWGIYFNHNEFADRNHILDYLDTRTGLVNKLGGIYSINFNHEINKIISYSLNGSYYHKNEETIDQYLGSNYWDYGDSLANANTGISNFSARYSPPINKLIFIWLFKNSGYPLINYAKSNQKRYSLSANINLNLFNHNARTGIEFSEYTLRNWQVNDQEALAYNFHNVNYPEYSDEELKDLILKFFGVNNYGYDIQGNVNNTGLYKAPNPVFYSIYIDDKFNSSDNIFYYFGLKYDHFNYDSKTLIDPTKSGETFDSNRIIKEDGLINTKNYSFLSPKASLKYYPLHNLSIALNYSKNVQSHSFSDIYQGYYSILYNTRGIQETLPVKLGNLTPIISNQFQASIYFNPVDNFNFELNLYNKKINNQTSLEIQQVTLGSFYSSPYKILGSSNSTKIWGSEFTAEYYTEGFYVNTVFSYQNAEESKKELRTISSTVLTTISEPFKREPDNVNKINLNVLINYNFEHFYKISDYFDDLNLSIFFSFNSGHVYRSKFFNQYGFIYYESGKTPPVYQADLKIDKGFTAFNKLNFDVYVYIINLFDRKNVYDVFAQTGSAEDDGYLSSPDGRATVDLLGESFSQLYKLIELYNPNGGQQTFFGPPRQIGFGIKLNI